MGIQLKQPCIRLHWMRYRHGGSGAFNKLAFMVETVSKGSRAYMQGATGKIRG